MRKDKFYCSYEEAQLIWESALEAAQDIPTNINGEADNEAIQNIRYKVDKLIKDRFLEIEKE